MDLRTALLTVVLLGIGYAVGALTSTAGETEPPTSLGIGGAPGAARTPEPGLDGRAVHVAASSDEIAAALARIEKLLVANPMAAGSSDEKVVARIAEVWRPILLEAIESHQTLRARTRLITTYEQRIAEEKEAIRRPPDPRGPAFQDSIAEYEKTIRELRERIEAIKKCRTAPELIDALVADPEAEGHQERSDAILIVYGDKHPD